MTEDLRKRLAKFKDEIGPEGRRWTITTHITECNLPKTVIICTSSFVLKLSRYYFP